MAIIYRVSGNRLLQFGTNSNETMNGDVYYDGNTRQNDEIHGRGGDDSLNGRGGKNILLGQGGDDYITVGNYSVYDRAYGGKGDDTFTVGDIPTHSRRIHLVSGGADDDTVILSLLTAGITLIDDVVGVPGARVARITEVERLIGTQHNDRIQLSGSLETIDGGEGDDTIDASGLKYSHSTSLAGGRGSDTITGSFRDDFLIDGDRLTPPTLNRLHYESDFLNGGRGHDTLVSLSGDDVVRGGGGSDSFYSLSGDDRLVGGSGNDDFYFTYPEVESYSDIHSINSLARAQAGLTGISINGGQGQDTLHLGTTYTSTLNLDIDLDRGVHIELERGFGIELGTRSEGRFTIRNVENVNGTARDDTLIGSTRSNHLFGFFGSDTLDGRGGADRLNGAGGNDILIGGRGNDILIGGQGNDTLTGNAGADRFEFGSIRGGGKDEITDFHIGQRDLIVMYGVSFADLILLPDMSTGGTYVNYVDGSIRLPGVSIDFLNETYFDFVDLGV
ncbi:MAG: calcium-binding protein [Pseudodonghicola sp.]|nr:calcium-binding protein [Pseudodonghicola sp.]